jgi:Kef-type K+ transport system membrane component KefB
MNALARAVVGITGAVIFGVTLFYAVHGDLRDHLALVFTGTLLTIGAVVLYCVVLEDRR